MNSSPIRDLQSSPATAPTVYSPLETRRHGLQDAMAYSNSNIATPRASSAEAASSGRLTIVKEESTTPTGPIFERVFLDELDPADAGFISRYVKITSYPPTVPHGQESEMQAVIEQMKTYTAFVNAVPLQGAQIAVKFDGIREACTAENLFQKLGFGVEYMTVQQYGTMLSQDPASIDPCEGQVKLTLSIEPMYQGQMVHATDADLPFFSRYAEEIAELYSTVRETKVVGIERTSAIVRAELNSIQAAAAMVNRLKAKRDDIPVKVADSGLFASRLMKVEHWTSSAAIVRPRVDARGNLMGFATIPPPTHVQKIGHTSFDKNNHIYKDRVEKGLDVRTTVMVRNIPNKMDHQRFKQVLDTYCFGTYDFVYLRIDFHTTCNVGYAFINFCDTHGLLQMLNNIENRRWPGFCSHKAAELSYATIQGKEALIQKFRNSSVMLEAHFCRPRLFWSWLDAFSSGFPHAVGREIPFPGSDNPAKLQRSVDSARSVGLYPPHGIGAPADHRNRHSEYDRGTPRDLQQSAMVPYGQPALPDYLKQACENWFAMTHNGGQLLAFDYIAAHAVASFMQQHPWMFQAGTQHAPGVIGQQLVVGPSHLPVQQAYRNGGLHQVHRPAQYRPSRF